MYLKKDRIEVSECKERTVLTNVNTPAAFKMLIKFVKNGGSKGDLIYDMD